MATGTRKTIRAVVNTDLCTGCGVCVGVCPKGALEIDPTRDARPMVREALCVECGLCWNICPGKGIAFRSFVSGQETEGAKHHPEVGPFRSIRSGFACDDDLRSRAASGGVATALAAYMLETGQADAAVVVRPDAAEPFRFKAGIARSRAELLSAQQSKYVMAPFDRVAAEILKGEGRYVVTGTPCQLAGIAALCEARPRLRERIGLMVGLFCGYVLEEAAVDCLCRRCSARREDVAEFHGWRAFENPGFFAFTTKAGKRHRLPLGESYDAVMARFARLRCHLCPDGMARCADVALGDLSTMIKGLSKNVILSRTRRGEEVLEDARKRGYIRTEDLEADRALEEGVIAFMRRAKVRMPLALISERRRAGRPVPDYDIEGVTWTSRDVLSARSFWSLSRIARFGPVARVLRTSARLNRLVGHEVYCHYERRAWKALARMGVF